MLQAGTWSIRMMIAGGVVCLWAVETTQPAAAGEAPAVRSIGHESQLLVDDVLLVRKTGVLRKVHSCEKLPQPVLASEEPWEQDGPDQRVYVYGTVLRDGPTGPFRMWYNRNSLVLYATSSDGLSWKRPRLGLCEYKGSKQNNIVFQLFHSPSVVYNPRPEDPDHRYNMLGYGRVSRPGYYTAHSADGLHWDLYTAITTTHGGYVPNKKITIALAKWRLDRLVSLGAGPAGGVVETVPLRCAGDRLVVNADAAAGELTVAVLDEHGRVLPGYAEADCLPLRADAVCQPVRWKDHDRLNTASPLRLRFHLSNARLYSYAVQPIARYVP